MENITNYIYKFLKEHEFMKIGFILISIVLIFCGITYISYTWETSKTAREKQVLSRAKAIEISLNGEMIKKLTAIPDVDKKLAYNSIKIRLINIVKQYQDAHVAYIYTLKNDKIYFIVDSGPSESNEYLPQEQEIKDAGIEYKKTFVDGKAIITQPTADRIEKWVRVLVPMKSNETGKIIAVLGMNYPADTFFSLAKINTIKSVLLVFFILISLITLYIVFNKNNQLKAERDKIKYLNYHDYLTGLCNRMFYEEELKRLDTKANLPLTILMGDVNGLKLINDSFGHSVGDELLKKAAEVINKGCRGSDIVARTGGDEFIILLPQTDSLQTEKIIKRIKNLLLEEKIASLDVSISFGHVTKTDENDKIQGVLKRAEENMYSNKLYESPSMREKTIDMIIKTLHEKNKREEQHSHRVSKLCQNMGQALGMSEHKINELKTVGLLHDIGKIAISESILNKAGKLTDDEWNEIKRHSEIGYRIISTVNEMSQMAEYILSHHERWDGKGYPRGLKGEEIPIESRIISIVDAYDAMVSERPYRVALGAEAAMHELEKNKGTQFDPIMVNIFIDKVWRIEEGGHE